jgi:anaerobic C4-dicarboxylate transporter
MTLHEFSQALYMTPISTGIRTTAGLIPTAQSIHIVAIAVVVGSALVTDLRLAGVLATDETPQTVIRRYLPWMWAALAVLVATGTILTVAEPNRVLANSVFWSKMALVVVAFGLTLLFRYPFLHPQFQLEHARWAALAKPMAWVSLLVWIAVIFCGRWIAYAI